MAAKWFNSWPWSAQDLTVFLINTHHICVILTCFYLTISFWSKKIIWLSSKNKVADENSELCKLMRKIVCKYSSATLFLEGRAIRLSWKTYLAKKHFYFFLFMIILRFDKKKICWALKKKLSFCLLVLFRLYDSFCKFCNNCRNDILVSLVALSSAISALSSFRSSSLDSRFESPLRDSDSRS